MTINRQTDCRGRRSWVAKWRMFGLTVAVASGCRLQTKPLGSGKTERQRRKRNNLSNCHERKPSLYREQQGRCALCGKEHPIKRLQIHHVLPQERFPELGSVGKNLRLLCPDCHRELHHNPVIATRWMDEAARQMNIGNWRQRYSMECRHIGRNYSN